MDEKPERENLNPEENREESRFKTPPIGETEKDPDKPKRAGPSYSTLLKDMILGKIKKEEPQPKDAKDVKESGIFGDRKSIGTRELELKMKNKSFSSEIYSKTRGKVKTQDVQRVFKKHFGKNSPLSGKGFLKRAYVKDLMANAGNKRSLSYQKYKKNKELGRCRDIKRKTELKKEIKNIDKDLRVMREIFRDPKKL